MKKLFFTLIAVFCISISVMNAQTYVGTFNSSGYFPMGIPSCFTNSGHSYVIVAGASYVAIYDNDFSTCLLNMNNFFSNYNHFDYKMFIYEDFSVNGRMIDGEQFILFTQNLFNSDDDFEYIERLETSWSIKSTNGNIVQTINADEGYDTGYPMVVKIDNIYYLVLREWSQSKDEGRILIYRIDREQGLSKVETDLSISAFPSIANRGQQITVELGEGNNAKEVIVINSLGQVIKRVPVQDGQKQISIQANELNSGLNVVNTRNQKGQGSCKIIVQ